MKMSFTSLSYYYFLAIALTLFLLIPGKWRSLFLIAASFFFYLSFNPYYITFILVTIIVSYTAARIIESSEKQWQKKAAVVFSVFLELTLLFLTKYWNPIAESTHLLRPLQILVPLGISFYSFQSIGYVVDVYRKLIPAEKNPVRYTLFVSFFPHLLAGPIEPAQHFLPQLKEEKDITRKMIFAGILLILAGLCKKLVIADHLGAYVDLVFKHPENYKGFSVALAAFFARYQIYCDFSGYTDIALGSALMFGYKLTPNFNRPFFSQNITEYWNRWHISLSQWIKKYIFYPLLATPATVLGARGLAVITFFVLGLWHGGTANYLLYGLLQGLFIAVDSTTKKWRTRFYQQSGISRHPRLLKAFGILLTFFLIVVPPTLFFRAPDLKTSLLLFQNAASYAWSFSDIAHIAQSAYLTHSLGIAIPALIIFEILDWIQKEKFNLSEYFSSRSIFLFVILVLLILGVIVVFGRFDAGSDFIYTRF